MQIMKDITDSELLVENYFNYTYYVITKMRAISMVKYTCLNVIWTPYTNMNLMKINFTQLLLIFNCFQFAVLHQVLYINKSRYFNVVEYIMFN